MTAKRILLLVIALGIVPALRADNTCTAATIKGAYGFSGSGLEMVHASPALLSSKSGSQLGRQAFAPVTFVGALSFTGDGMLSGSFTANGNGHQESAAPFTGAYVVNADCTGSIVVAENDGQESHFAMTIADAGKEVLAIQTDAGLARTFMVKKQ